MQAPELITVRDVAQEAAKLFSALAEEAVKARGRFRVVLSGGSTPLAMYDLLKSRALPWRDTWLYWGDERFVPYSDPRSNYGAAKARLLDAAPVPEHQVHPWPFVPGRPEVAAGAYAEVLREKAGEEPDFDLVLLGLGEDAHTASLFPGDDALGAEGLTVVARPESQAATRLSLTARALSRGRVVAFLVAGEGKREALAATLYGERDPLKYPAQAISARERLLWITDQAVAKP
jgi:6-phosphogluconolactonase